MSYTPYVIHTLYTIYLTQYCFLSLIIIIITKPKKYLISKCQLNSIRVKHFKSADNEVNKVYYYRYNFHYLHSSNLVARMGSIYISVNK